MSFSPRPSLDGLIEELEKHFLDSDRSLILVLFDGLGTQFLDDRAPTLRASWRETIRAPFPSTTTVSLTTIATGKVASQHGIVGHLLWWEELGQVINTLKFVDLSGDAVQSRLRDHRPPAQSVGATG